MRRKKTITIEEAGRDAGKVFILTEMPATLADEWITQYGYLLAKAMQEFPTYTEGSSGAKLIQVRVMKDPSLRAWRDCVRYQHAPNLPEQAIQWESPACQVEEMATINLLLGEVFELHTGFFSAENPSTSDSPSTTSPAAGSSTMQTSRRPSLRSFLPGGQR